MAYPSECSALSYVIARQIDCKVDYCKSLLNTRFMKSENLYRKDLLSHYGCVNAIEFSNQGDLLVSGESGDDGDTSRDDIRRAKGATEGGRDTGVSSPTTTSLFRRSPLPVI